MLPKHWARRVKTQESLQRTLCRAAVLLCAVVPVLYLGAATCYWKLPWVSRGYANHLAATISDSFGVSATIGELKHLTPNRVEIRDLKVVHPETFEVMLEVPALIADRYASQWEVSMQSPVCALDQVLKLSRMAHDRFLCRADDRLAPVRIMAKSTSLMDQGKLMLKGDTETVFLPDALKTSLRVVYTPEGNAQQSIDLRFIRDRETVEHQTKTKLVASGIGVSMRLLRDMLPVTRYFGEEATFEGAAEWVVGRQDGMRIEESLIRNVQWDRVTSPLAYQMTGQGNIYIKESTIENGQIQKASGILDANQGSIPNKWLAKAMSTLGLRIPTDLSLGPGLLHEYRSIKLGFELSPEGIQIIGGTQLKPPLEKCALVVLSDANGPLIYEGERDADSRHRVLKISDLVSWVCASPYDAADPNAVTSASYQAEQSPGPDGHLRAYLTTVLPTSSMKR